MSLLMALMCLKKRNATTRITVYEGIAMSMPSVPPIWPAMRSTMNISSGVDLMLVE